MNTKPDHTWGSRYNGMDDASIKERPRNEAEAALRDIMIQKEAKDILAKHENAPSYRKSLAIELARQTVGSQEWGTAE